MIDADRESILNYRLRVQGLTNAPKPIAAAEVSMLDVGVQNTGPDGARWALIIRGAGSHLPTDLPNMALAWTLRGAPHLYRRVDLPAVARAVRLGRRR